MVAGVESAVGKKAAKADNFHTRGMTVTVALKKSPRTVITFTWVPDWQGVFAEVYVIKKAKPGAYTRGTRVLIRTKPVALSSFRASDVNSTMAAVYVAVLAGLK